MQDLQVAYNKTMENLKLANKVIIERGQAKAKAERDYRVKRAKQSLILQVEGKPISIINDLVRGNEKVADLKMEWDIAESDYESNIEYIRMCKIEINSIIKMMEAERVGT